MSDNKVALTVRLTPEMIDVIKRLAKGLGISQAAVIEIAMRKLTQGGLDDTIIQISNLPEQDSD